MAFKLDPLDQAVFQKLSQASSTKSAQSMPNHNILIEKLTRASNGNVAQSKKNVCLKKWRRSNAGDMSSKTL